MTKKLKLNKNLQRGVSLIELIVVIFIITMFSLILVSDFPKIQRQYALSRATYKLSQDVRRAQDLGLSGIAISDINKDKISLKGYGIYVNNNLSLTKYLLYADVNGDTEYNGDFDTTLCGDADQIIDGPLVSDCPIEIIDISLESQSLSIKQINNVNVSGYVSINFEPPSPVISISNRDPNYSYIEIVLKNTDNTERKVFVNTAGLINVN